MILQALYQYYQRKELAPLGFEEVPIEYVIELNSDGSLVGIVSRADVDDKKKKKVTTALVPQAVKRVSIVPNLLWDNIGYVFGFDTKDKPERARALHAAFIQKIKDTFPHTTDEGIQAVLKFYESGAYQAVFQHPLWAEMTESSGNISFQLVNHRELICQRNIVTDFIRQQEASNDEATIGTCLITGETSKISRLHASIKGVSQAQPTGANIIAFDSAAFTSFGKERGSNAPVGRLAEFSYTTALNHLLGKDSKQRMKIGDATTVWWAGEKVDLEQSLADLFEESPKDDPDRNASAIAHFLSSEQQGKMAIDSDETPFFILGLAPNAARLSIRFWYHGTVAELSGHLRRYFAELRIVHAPHLPDYLPLPRLLRATAILGKYDNVSPNLAGQVMAAILKRTPYPYTLLNAVVARIRAEREVTYERAAWLKAYLMRCSTSESEEITVGLNLKNKQVPYRLGRLFATLEKIQMAALGDINAGIRDRYYGAASSTPIAVFPRLLKLANHHLNKMEYKGQAVNMEKLIGEILSEVDDMPAVLSLPDQARFALGYYHQRQDFFSKNAAHSADNV